MNVGRFAWVNVTASSFRVHSFEAYDPFVVVWVSPMVAIVLSGEGVVVHGSTTNRTA